MDTVSVRLHNPWLVRALPQGPFSTVLLLNCLIFSEREGKDFKWAWSSQMRGMLSPLRGFGQKWSVVWGLIVLYPYPIPNSKQTVDAVSLREHSYLRSVVEY